MTVIIRVRMNPNGTYSAVEPSEEEPVPAPDQLSDREIKCYLQGLVSRDCDGAPSPEARARWLALPEQVRARARRDSGDLRMVTLTDQREDGASLRMYELDRAGVLDAIARGYVLDEATTAWALEAYAEWSATRWLLQQTKDGAWVTVRTGDYDEIDEVFDALRRQRRRGTLRMNNGRYTEARRISPDGTIELVTR